MFLNWANNQEGRWKDFLILALETSLFSQLTHAIHRGYYISTHVLLNLLNELGKRDKMRGLLSILSLFRNEFNKFNDTGARVLDSIFHMALKLLKNRILA